MPILKGAPRIKVYGSLFKNTVNKFRVVKNSRSWLKGHLCIKYEETKIYRAENSRIGNEICMVFFVRTKNTRWAKLNTNFYSPLLFSTHKRNFICFQNLYVTCVIPYLINVKTKKTFRLFHKIRRNQTPSQLLIYTIRLISQRKIPFINLNIRRRIL
jgi:hypothetical protein